MTRVRDLGLKIGRLPAGAHNAINDVAGVRVGHTTLRDGGRICTGVTAVIPHDGDVFREKCAAAVYTINGFGKAVGFEQIRTRGTLETPILLTNTLNVGRVSDALVGYMLRDRPDIGVTTGTVNVVVGECNDGFLNDIRGRHVGEADVLHALESARGGAVEEGCVGAGTGTSCFQFKGGIGTSSRVTPEGFTVGALIQSNYGSRAELSFYGVPLGAHLADAYLPEPGPGSIMMILATDAPLDSRQLTRVAMRAAHALGRTGTVSREGSGDFVIAFSTVNRWAHAPQSPVEPVTRLTEHAGTLDNLFLAAVESLEEAIWNSVTAAVTTTGRDGNTLHALPHDVLLRWTRHYRPDLF